MYFNQISVISIEKFKHLPEWHCLKHSHEFFQLTYILEGSGCMFTDYDEYEMKTNQMFFYPPDYNHEYIASRSNPLVTVDVKFDIYDRELLSCFENLAGFIGSKPANLRGTLENLLIEAVNKDALSLDIINSSFFVLLLGILRQIKRSEGDPANREIPLISGENHEHNSFHEVIDYINKNIHHSICLNDLARLVNLDPAYFCKLFKKRYGTTPLHYINNLRLNKAKDLLMNTDDSITDIANNLGFQTVQYFSSQFKHKEKVSPLEYKNTVRNNIFIQFDNRYHVPWGTGTASDKKGNTIIYDSM